MNPGPTRFCWGYALCTDCVDIFANLAKEYVAMIHETGLTRYFTNCQGLTFWTPDLQPPAVRDNRIPDPMVWAYGREAMIEHE